MNAPSSLVRWLSNVVLCGATVATVCHADTVYLLDGREVNGTIINEDQQTVVVKTSRGGNRSIRRTEIDTIVREKIKTIAKDEPKAPEATRPAGTANPVIGGPSSAPLVVPTPGATSKNLPNIPATTPTTNVPALPTSPVGNVPVKAPVVPGDPIRSTAPEGPITQPGNAAQPRVPSGPQPIIPAPATTAPIAPTTTAQITAASRDTAASGALPVTNFPEFSKRMSKRKEALFADAMDTIKVAYKNPEDTTRAAALSDIRALGSDVVPYLWAGVQNDDAEVRVACMKLIGQLNGRNCTKRVIETLYMTMPQTSVAAFWNVPFVDEMKSTLTAITGQSFITVESRRLGVQDGLKKYIEWYKANFKSLPRQIGEPELDPTEKNFDAKLAELRELKLTKREWSAQGGMPVDNIAGPNKTSPPKPAATVGRDSEREADRKFGDAVPTVSDDNVLKRPNDKPGTVDNDQVLKRPGDRDSNPNNRRDPPSETTEPVKDPLVRPQDLRKQ
ncbi:MAG: hypothetical protein WCT04_02965 [Planctomycetota bacterium]